MQLQLTRPELEKFITDKVNSGDFPTPQAVVEDALTRMMQDEQSLTDEDIAAIDESEAQLDAGQGIDFDAFASEMHKKYGRS